MKVYAIGVNGGFVNGKLFRTMEYIVEWFKSKVWGEITIYEEKGVITVEQLVGILVQAGDADNAVKVCAKGLVEMGDDYAEMYIYEFDLEE